MIPAEFFQAIAQECPEDRIISMCKFLEKRCALDIRDDLRDLQYLSYCLYAYERKDLAKRCIIETLSFRFQADNRHLWDPIFRMWGLCIRIIRAQGKEKSVVDIRTLIARQMPFEFRLPHLDLERRERAVRERINRASMIRSLTEKNRTTLANEFRLRALTELIGYTETGCFPNLNAEREAIEQDIQNYIAELAKEKKFDPVVVETRSEIDYFHPVEAEPESQPQEEVNIPERFRELYELILHGDSKKIERYIVNYQTAKIDNTQTPPQIKEKKTETDTLKITVTKNDSQPHTTYEKKTSCITEKISKEYFHGSAESNQIYIATSPKIFPTAPGTGINFPSVPPFLAKLRDVTTTRSTPPPEITGFFRNAIQKIQQGISIVAENLRTPVNAYPGKFELALPAGDSPNLFQTEDRNNLRYFSAVFPDRTLKFSTTANPVHPVPHLFNRMALGRAGPFLLNYSAHCRAGP